MSSSESGEIESVSAFGLPQDAPVLGKVVWVGAVCAVAGLERRDAGEWLQALARNEFVRRERRSSVGGEGEFAWRLSGGLAFVRGRTRALAVGRRATPGAAPRLRRQPPRRRRARQRRPRGGARRPSLRPGSQRSRPRRRHDSARSGCSGASATLRSNTSKAPRGSSRRAGLPPRRRTCSRSSPER